MTSDTLYRPTDPNMRVTNPKHYGAQAALFVVLQRTKWDLESPGSVSDRTVRVWAEHLGALLPRLTFASPALIVAALEPLAKAQLAAETADDLTLLVGAPTLRDIAAQLLPFEQHLAKDGFQWKELAGIMTDTLPHDLPLALK